MAKVNLTINGKSYALGCSDGEEERLEHLGGLLNDRVSQLANQFGQIGDLRLMVIAAITMLDEIDDMSKDQAEKVSLEMQNVLAESEQSVLRAERAGKEAEAAMLSSAQKIEGLISRLNANANVQE